MRLLAVCVALSPALASADDSLWEAELQLGYGMSRRGTNEMATTQGSPLSFAALGAYAVSSEPHVLAYGGLVGETLSRSSVGMTAGARIDIPSTPVRVGGGGVWMFAPETLWGARATAGSCFGKTLALCGDFQLTAYFAGTNLAADETELQVQLVLGVAARGH